MSSTGSRESTHTVKRKEITPKRTIDLQDGDERGLSNRESGVYDQVRTIAGHRGSTIDNLFAEIDACEDCEDNLNELKSLTRGSPESVDRLMEGVECHVLLDVEGTLRIAQVLLTLNSSGRDLELINQRGTQRLLTLQLGQVVDTSEASVRKFRRSSGAPSAAAALALKSVRAYLMVHTESRTAPFVFCFGRVDERDESARVLAAVLELKSGKAPTTTSNETHPGHRICGMTVFSQNPSGKRTLYLKNSEEAIQDPEERQKILKDEWMASRYLKTIGQISLIVGQVSLVEFLMKTGVKGMLQTEGDNFMDVTVMASLTQPTFSITNSKGRRVMPLLDLDRACSVRPEKLAQCFAGVTPVFSFLLIPSPNGHFLLLQFKNELDRDMVHTMYAVLRTYNDYPEQYFD
ncbi:MAG: uncharacterized protein KVP18_001164 [Porospora cf. gigantea A]|uniref:uncharacterized protein n=1 Tax=Porospora cf. gigantea A TaxID=2853593 RepID=UPI00355947D8|nr:MAG: hypothetical protein KVP18_001164 [Porospora cf. gigantea A]